MADQPPPRRRFQFRLPTLMIGVTLLAIYCGTVAWFLHDGQRLIRERDDAEERARDAAKREAMTREDVLIQGERLNYIEKDSVGVLLHIEDYLAKVWKVEREKTNRDALEVQALLKGRIAELEWQLEEQKKAIAPATKP